MLTVKQLMSHKGAGWSEEPKDDLPDAEQILWFMSSHLGTMMELYEDTPTMLATSQYALGSLREAKEHFAKLDQPLPLSATLVLLRIDRCLAGLDELG